MYGGQTFRDMAQNDSCTAQKYQYMKEFFKGQEYNGELKIKRSTITG
jgi:hypothetical protein